VKLGERKRLELLLKKHVAESDSIYHRDEASLKASRNSLDINSSCSDHKWKIAA